MAAKPNPNQKKKGALNQDPKGFTPGGDQAALDLQQKNLEAKIKQRQKQGLSVDNYQKRLSQVTKAKGALGTDPGTTAPAAPPAGAAPPGDIIAGLEPIDETGNNFLRDRFDFLKNRPGFDPGVKPVGEFNPQMQQQAAFNPGDYNALRQRATDTAMQEFNRQNQGRFAQEDQQFAQQMADQGIDENSEKYRYMKGQFDLQRQNQIQGAQNNAFQLGQGEAQQAYGQSANTYGMNQQGQQQAYNQASNTFGMNQSAQGQNFNQAQSTYQMPLQDLAAMSPYYQAQNQRLMQQGQQGWMGDQNQMDREWQKALQESGFDQQKAMAKMQHKFNKDLQASAPRGGGGGGGGLSYEQQLAMMDRQMYNNMVLQGLQNGQGMPYPGAAGGAAQGIGQGIGIGLTTGLVR